MSTKRRFPTDFDLDTPTTDDVVFAHDATTNANKKFNLGDIVDLFDTAYATQAELDDLVLTGGQRSVASLVEVFTGTDNAKVVTALRRAEAERVYDARRDAPSGSITSSTLQASIDIVNALGGGVVALPHDTTVDLSTARVNVKTGVTVRGHRSTIIASTNANGAFMFVGNYAAIEGVTIDLAGSAGTAIGINASAGATLTDNAVRGCRIINAANNACRISSAYDGFAFVNNEIEGCANGFSAQPGAASKGLLVSGNRFRDVGNVNIQVYATSVLHTGVIITGNVLADFDTPSTAIPIEVTGSRAAIIAGNTIASAATRGVSTGGCEVLVISGNTIVDQTAYAVELNGGKWVSITGNTTRNCACLFDVTGTSGLEDLAVTGNVYNGSGKSSAATAVWVMNVRNGKRVRISGNVITDWQYLGGGIRVGNASTTEDVTIADNDFHVVDANTPASSVVNVSTALRTRIKGNRVTINRNLAAGDDSGTVLQVAVNATNTDNHIEGNDVVYLGTTSSATNHTALGHRNTGAGACVGLRIAGNKVKNGRIGIYSNTTSTDAEIVDNETRTCATADTVPTTLAVRRIQREHEASAAPASGTWRVGDRVWNTAPAAGGTPGWVCTTAGTPGTWKAMANLAP